jgi:hypothetical protein
VKDYIEATLLSLFCFAAGFVILAYTFLNPSVPATFSINGFCGFAAGVAYLLYAESRLRLAKSGGSIEYSSSK